MTGASRRTAFGGLATFFRSYSYSHFMHMSGNEINYRKAMIARGVQAAPYSPSFNNILPISLENDGPLAFWLG